MDATLASLIKSLQPLVRIERRFERGAIDFARPKTEIEKLKRDVHASLACLDGERLRKLLEYLLSRLSSVDHKRALDLDARPRSHQARLLCNYLDDIEREVPFLPALVFGSSALPTLDFLELKLAAHPHLLAAARRRGEARANSLRELALLLEAMYGELATILYELERVRRGSQIHRGLDFGNILREAAFLTRDTLPGFVDEDAAKFRNAAAHRHWNYEPSTDRLRLHNRRRGETNWERSFTLPDFYQRLRGFLRNVDHFYAALLWRTSRSFITVLLEPPLCRIFEPGVLAAPPQGLEAEIQQAMVLRFEPVKAKLETSGWTSRRAALEERTSISH